MSVLKTFFHISTCFTLVKFDHYLFLTRAEFDHFNLGKNAIPVNELMEIDRNQSDSINTILSLENNSIDCLL